MGEIGMDITYGVYHMENSVLDVLKNNIMQITMGQMFQCNSVSPESELCIFENFVCNTWYRSMTGYELRIHGKGIVFKTSNL